MRRSLFFEDGSTLEKQAFSTCFNSIFVSSDNNVMLWHFRLGHSSFLYLKTMFPSLFINKNPSFFHCEICELTKHHCTSFPPQPHVLSAPFSVIHSHVWGASRVPTCLGKHWFITFTNDHSRLTWVYLLKQTSEAKQVFKNFHNMIKTQFQTHL